MVDRTSPPQFKQIKEFQIKQARTELLDNGLPIHIIQTGKLPVIRIEIIYRAGAWLEPKNGVVHFATKMLGEGTSKRSGKEIHRLVDQYGAFLDLRPGFDRIEIELYTLTKYVSTLLPLLKEMIFDSAFMKKELDTIKNLQKQKVKIENQKNSTLASKKIRQLLFGSTHPYGRNLTEESIDQIDETMVKNYYLGTVLSRFEIFVAGDYQPDFFKLFNSYFGTFQIKERKPRSYFPTTVEKDKILIKKESSLQSSIRIGKILFKKNHPEYLNFLVLNEILGGYFGSRLMKNIREEKGFSYGIYSSVVGFKNEGFFVIGTDVKKENTNQTIDEILKEMKELRSNPVPDQELEKVKNYMIGNVLTGINTPFALMDKYKAVYYYDLDYGFYDKFLETVNGTNPQTLLELADKHLPEEDMIEVIVGDV